MKNNDAIAVIYTGPFNFSLESFTRFILNYSLSGKKYKLDWCKEPDFNYLITLNFKVKPFPYLAVFKFKRQYLQQVAVDLQLVETS